MINHQSLELPISILIWYGPKDVWVIDGRMYSDTFMSD